MTLNTRMRFLPLIAALFFAGCVAPARGPEQTSAFSSQTGIASWYGPNLHGRATASGEIFDQDTLSAAHRTWPMPSLAEVTNLENGRHVVVRINDRGPFSEGRIIDLSRAAARALDFEQDGQTRVTIRYIGPAPGA